MPPTKKQKNNEMARTALDLSPVERKRYHPFEKGGRMDSQLLTRLQVSAEDEARSIARELVKRFGAYRVVLFGSVALGKVHKRSDIDLAVWGIPPKYFYRAVAFSAGYSKEWKVDLVDAEDCRENLKASILRDGVEL